MKFLPPLSNFQPNDPNRSWKATVPEDYTVLSASPLNPPPKKKMEINHHNSNLLQSHASNSSHPNKFSVNRSSPRQKKKEKKMCLHSISHVQVHFWAFFFIGNFFPFFFFCPHWDLNLETPINPPQALETSLKGYIFGLLPL